VVRLGISLGGLGFKTTQQMLREQNLRRMSEWGLPPSLTVHAAFLTCPMQGLYGAEPARACASPECQAAISVA